MPPVDIVPIADPLVPPVCAFLARSIDRGISADDFAPAFNRRWADGERGFALVADGEIVGALGTIRSRRVIAGCLRSVCNLSSWAVAPAFRTYGPALLRRAISDRDTIYTNFTASDAVVELLRAFGFIALRDRERILLPFGRGPHADGVTGTDAVAAFLEHDPPAARAVVDHRDTRVRWVGVDVLGQRCGFALHAMRVRGVPFAHVLYCSRPDRFGPSLRDLQRLSRQKWGFHLISWSEWQFGRAGSSIVVRRPRPVMIKAENIAPQDLDALYTELTLLPILA